MRRQLLDRMLMHLVGYSYTFAQRLTFSVPWRLEGQELRVPFLSGAGFQNLRIGPKDIALQRVVQHILPRTPGAIVDVGCNIGHFMELCVLAERERRYVGFDVSLACCYYLERFIRENRLPAHSVFPIALSNHTGVQQYHSNGQFDVCASLTPEAHPRGRYSGGGVVLTDTGDRILARLKLDGISLIKIDVEGLELEVLRGLQRTIERERPYLIFEILIYAHLGDSDADPEDTARVIQRRRQTAIAIEQFCRERDYVVYRMRQNGALEYRQHLDPGASRDSIAMDHLALPREKAADLLRGYRYGIDVAPDRAVAA